MKRITLFTALFISFLLFATNCNTAKQNEKNEKCITFIQARNYFANANVDSTTYYIVTTEEDFMKKFGMATAMGTNGKPTEIDFSKQIAIAIISPETYYDTQITATKLKKASDKSTTTLEYTKTVGSEKRSYSILPIELIFVDKNIGTDIQFKDVTNQ